MTETELRPLVERLYLHVAAFPWKDEGFVRSEAAQKAAKDQIVDSTIRDIINLSEGKNRGED